MNASDYERETARMAHALAYGVRPEHDDRWHRMVASEERNPTYTANIDAIARLLASRREGWVDVRERLPETEGLFLVVVPGQTNPEWMEVAWWDKRNREWLLPRVSEKDPDIVTHWMPLPTPPEVKP